MHESVIGEFQVPILCIGFFSRLRILENKWWVRLVAAAAVTPAPLVGVVFIGPKASVAGLENPLRNCQAQLDSEQGTLPNSRPGGVEGMFRGAVKCYNPLQTTCGEGVQPERI